MNNNAQQIAFSFNGLAQGTSTTFNAYSVDYNTDTTRYEERDPDPMVRLLLFTKMMDRVSQVITQDLPRLKEGNQTSL